MNIIADRIRSLRSEQHLSQQELADILEIGRSTLANYEQGKREPNFETLEKIADYFNVDMNYLTGFSNVKNLVALSCELPIPSDFWPDEDEETRIERYLAMRNAIENQTFDNNFNKKEHTLRVIRRASEKMTDSDLDKMVGLLNLAFDDAFKDNEDDN